MTIHLPLEIHTQIFKILLDDLYDPKHPQEAFKLRLICKSIQGILDPVLYRNIKSPSYNGLHILCRTIIPRPRLAACVEEIHLEEDEESESDEDEEDEEEEEEEEENTDAESDSGSESSEYSDSKVQQARMREESKLLAGAADHLKSRFTADPSHALALEKNDLSWLARSTRNTRKWLLLFQLSNLKSLTLETHTDTFTNMAMFLRLPRLEELNFAVLAPGPDGPSCHNYAPPEDILESLIRHTDQLKSLRFEDMSGTVFSPVQHDAPKLKRILEQHAADTLTYLSVCLCNNDEKDWRQEQEFSYIRGHFGSMKKFTRLKGLIMQLEVLLGKPNENGGLRLKDVLPLELEYFTGLNLPDYHGADDSDRIWDEEQYIPQFEDLAEVMMRDCRAFPLLGSVKMHLDRKDYFSSHGECLMKGQYNDGLLGDSQIYFGFVRGPYAYDGPGPD
ncbi:uncharacterized protein NFIA_060670 [Aspergillus fischeri NRRL 181]|uniref:Uncharacterized protein n=1 Tax=Neosartorya fischeri (strain ATCC 1020 / DSM 3700 / CBS 544.65 / FGSC A1164 / JCM 1740 / NRRL 181 / WB 181) TaxID=331117 RepID=A1DPJ0_NEOFI|nr:uncharacterized protein NFIA_060670 [Aspergillus fischeri NRRL 181]EAW16711.1 hypothetical protein NFIA_060670 [Aspergillus fischeri NRRL 181]